MKTSFIFLATIALQAALLGQQQGGLLYTCRFDERSNQSAAGLSAINEVRDDEVQYVLPDAGGAFKSKQWAPHLGYNMLLGDHDGDSIYHDPNLFGRIDALLRPRKLDGSSITIPLYMRLLFFSPRDDVITVRPSLAAPYSNNLLQSDVGRIVPLSGGPSAVAFELFLTGAQVRSAFGIPPGTDLNLDAVCLHMDPNMQPNDQGIYLSFEKTQTIMISTGVHIVKDGAILRIPGRAITWTVSPYDGESALVQSVIQNSGQIILLESDVDTVVSNSMIRDNGGIPLNHVEDVDGLTLPDTPGFFTSPYTPGPIHHLWFSGYRMSGAGIVSTEAGGTIPTLNGVPMGSVVATTGTQVGLVTPNVRSLAGLALTPMKLIHFVTDSPTPHPLGPGVIRVQIGGCDIGNTAVILWNLGETMAGGVDISFNVSVQGFREWYPHLLTNLVPIGPDGCGEWSANIPPGAYWWLSSSSPPKNLRFQAVAGVAAFWLSTPCKIQF